MGLGASFARLAAAAVVVCALVACGDLAENGAGEMSDAGAADSGTPVDCPACGQADADGVVDDGSTVDSTLPGDDAAKDTGTPEPVDGGEDTGDTQPRDAGGDTGSILDSTLPEDSGEDSGPPDEDTGTTAHDSGTDTGGPEDSGPHDSGSSDSGAHDSSADDTGSPRVDSGQAPDTGQTVDSGSPSDDSGQAVDSGQADTGSSEEDGAAGGEDSGPTIPDGGLPPTPGEVACGNMSCGVPQNQCCISLTGTATCVPSTEACVGGITVGCNEASDCASGDVCCVSIIASATTTAKYACQAGPCGSAASGHAQACRTNQECIGGAACTVQDCEGVTVELCGLPKFDNLYQCTPE